MRIKTICHISCPEMNSGVRWMRRLILLCTLFVCLQFHSYCNELEYAQSVKITINEENVTLTQLFNKIERLSHFLFFYVDSDVKDIKVSVNVKEANIEEILKISLKGTKLMYQIKGRNINILPVQNQVQQSKVKKEPIWVKGTVLDENGLPLPGVNILIEGSAIGTITDIDGRFSIQVPELKSILSFSYLGYVTQKLSVNASRDLKVIMGENSQVLSEVVVVGYGVQKKETVTGAISSISNKEIVKSPVGALSNALVGRVSGLSAIQKSGEPGFEESTIRIRGVGTYSGDQNPLVVIDGIVRDLSTLNMIDPNDIETINVLKDASATAVYGVRGANGVIIATTKKGVQGKPQISFSANFGYTTPTTLPKLTDSYQFGRLRNEAIQNDGVRQDNLIFTEDELWKFQNNRDYTPDEVAAMTHLTPAQRENLLNSPALYYTSHDYMSEFFRKSAPQQQYNINVSGGTEKVNYFTSVGFLNQEGLTTDYGYSNAPTSTNNKRTNFRSNFDFNVIKTIEFSIGISGQISNTKIFLNDYNESDQNSRYRDMLKNIYESTPFAGPGIVDGKLINGFAGDSPLDPTKGTSGKSPVASLLNKSAGRVTKSTLNTFFKIKHKMDYLTKGLSLRGTLSYDNYFSKTVNENSPIPMYTVMRDPENPTQNLYFGGILGAEKYEEKAWYKERKLYLEGGIDYDRTFGKHHVTALALITAERLTKPGLLYNVPQGMYGVVGRVTYGYDNRYQAEFNVGYNGSENFAPGKQFGFFPAVSAGWTISQEPFFPKNDWVTWIKVRGSYGQTGNSNIGGKRFLYLPSSWEMQQSYVWPFSGYNFGSTDGSILNPWITGKSEKVVGNPDVTWERKISYNIAAEIRLFRDRLSFTADFFNENRNNILTTLETVPGIVGIDVSVLPPVNVGKMSNKGYEMSVSWRDEISDFNYQIGGQVSYARNKIDYMADAPYEYTWMNKTGFSYGQYKAYVNSGFYNSAEEVANHPYNTVDGNCVQAGDLRIIDVNGDGVIDNRDMTPTGYSNVPRCAFSGNLFLEYKGFEISALFTGSLQGTFSMAGYMISPFAQNKSNALEYMYDGRWTMENYLSGKAISYPRMSLNTTGSQNGPSNSFWYRSTDHVKLKNLEIAYTFKTQKFLSRLKISALRLYFNSNNLLTFGGKDLIEGIDPELSQDEKTTEGVIYPITRVYNFGFKIQF